MAKDQLTKKLLQCVCCTVLLDIAKRCQQKAQGEASKECKEKPLRHEAPLLKECKAPLDECCLHFSVGSPSTPWSLPLALTGDSLQPYLSCKTTAQAKKLST